MFTVGLPFDGAIGKEIFEGFVSGQPAQYGFAFGRVNDFFDNVLPYGFKLDDEPAVVIGELVLKFFPQMPGVGWAVAIGADSDLQRAALNDSGDEEIAKVGLVNNIA